MNRRESLLAALSVAGEAEHSPVQIQKLLFLMEKGIGGTGFDFKPYDYGPFDAAVYEELRGLVSEGLVRKIQTGRGWALHALTAEGVEKGRQLVQTLSPTYGEYLGQISAFVRKLSFNDLVSAIYKAFPDMKANSVFRS